MLNAHEKEEEGKGNKEKTQRPKLSTARKYKERVKVKERKKQPPHLLLYLLPHHGLCMNLIIYYAMYIVYM